MPISEFDLNEAWRYIEEEYDISKKAFGKKINFVKDKYKRTVIFRDVGQAYMLARSGFNKPSVILTGSILEELLRLYLAIRLIEFKFCEFQDVDTIHHPTPASLEYPFGALIMA